MKSRSKIHSLNRLPLYVALVGCLWGTAVFAQSTGDEATEEQAKKESSDIELAPMTVTGSLIRRKEYESASPVQVLSADTSAEIGQVDVAEFLQQTSVAAGSTQITNQFSGFVVEGGTGVQTLSLRGLGAQRTLVLLNGQRPGPAGTRGEVGAFDLNVIPRSILQRAEILKDGSSSIYGSDAVAGVVNLITRKTVDRPELNASIRLPFDSGGEVYTVSGATGWNFDNGSIVLAGEWFRSEPLLSGDRDYLSCPEDLARDAAGNRIDREDRSILAGTSLAGCNNLYANTVIDAFTGVRYIPSPDGVTIGLLPGYRPRTNGTYANGGQAYYEDQLNFPFYGDQQIVDQTERLNLYFATDFRFDDVNWTTEWIYNRRDTDTHRYRQFFPLTGGNTAPGPYQYANSPDFATPVPSGVAQPIMPFPSDSSISVDYFYVASALEGVFGFTDTWSWRVNGSYTRSDGDYSSLGIVASRTGDVRFDDTAPRVDYFSPDFLNGNRMAELVSAIGEWNTGNTRYDQTVLTAIATGDLFEMPAGPVGAAFGAEHRRFSIDDQPSALSQNGDLWGQSSAQVTKGDDNVSEIFAELEFPLLEGMTGVESLSLNASGRVFDYDSVSGTDNVWKLGLNWQIIPSVRFRATKGTSYRAPALYELYLGNQTGFQSQLAVDPCIDWQNSSNEFVRANCAAVGIPGNYAGGASSATVISGGGAGVLKPEGSNALTAGFVFTPEFAPISVAFDYFEIEVIDQVGQLGAGAILGGCYGAPVFPNAFCDLFDRNGASDPTAPFAITNIRSSYLNINKQKTKGYDLLFRYDNDFAAGNLQVEGQFTYVFEDIQQLFDSSLASGFETNDFNGDIGRPKLTGSIRTSFERGDWNYTWLMDYVKGTQSLALDGDYTYFGFQGAQRDIKADPRLYHTVSVRYVQPDWAVTVGIRNLLNDKPPYLTAGGDTRYGNIPAFATQYDIFGRSLFAQFNYKF